MVMYTVNDAAGAYTLDDLPAVTKILTRTTPDGQTDFFFTSTNVYNAAMFGVQDAGGGWLGALFYGRTTIDASGQVGFLPDAQVEGSVRGVSADAFAVDYVVEHGSNDGLRAALFSGDDTLIGNGFGGSLSGEAGDDLIIGVASNGFTYLDGGDGNDVIDGRDDLNAFRAESGGRGADFLFMGDGNINASGGKGTDTFFFDQDQKKFVLVGVILDFEKRDLLQLDPMVFKALAARFSEENFVAGPAALDANDFLLFNDGYLLYDPDGSGPHRSRAFAQLSANAPLTWRNILVSDAIPTTGDPGSATSPAHHDLHAQALRAALHATGLLP